MLTTQPEMPIMGFLERQTEGPTAGVGLHMTSDQFLTYLNIGVACWNEFRRGRGGEHLNLNELNLRGARLPGIDLHQAYLMDADLRDSYLEHARLQNAILRKADLSRANLVSAELDGADLCRANLSYADLRGASISGAFLKKTDLRGTDLSTTSGLTMKQLEDAWGDASTKLPAGFSRPANWLMSAGTPSAA
ncbi:MAG: pentapeptide repeat protein [Bryobacterales bacterium]|nr:pentapeptide repeat protein [Bryobacterales bacterium]